MMIGKTLSLSLLLVVLVTDSYGSSIPRSITTCWNNEQSFTKFRIQKTKTKSPSLAFINLNQQQQFATASTVVSQRRSTVDTNIIIKNNNNIFQPRIRQQQQKMVLRRNNINKCTHFFANPNDSNSSDENPVLTVTNNNLDTIRKIMGSLGILGSIETAYITYNSVLQQQATMYCPTTTTTNIPFISSLLENSGLLLNNKSNDCLSVLSGQYSTWPGTDIPLSAFGFVAYTIVSIFALYPLLIPSIGTNEKEKTIMNNNSSMNNRILLGSISTGMGIFSIVLVSFSIGILNESCFYCIMSAIVSISLMFLSIFGGILPQQVQVSNSKQVQIPEELLTTTTTTTNASTMSIGSSAVIAVSAVLFVLTGGFDNYNILQPPSATASVGRQQVEQQVVQVATSNTGTVKEPVSLLPKLVSPPIITTTSSIRAIELCKQLQNYNTKFYGAYWCSHCYEQKQTLGTEAMTYIPYIECDIDGINNQRSLCKSKKIPGYPTWEINNILYPGEQSIEELEDIITNIKKNKQL